MDTIEVRIVLKVQCSGPAHASFQCNLRWNHTLGKFRATMTSGWIGNTISIVTGKHYRMRKSKDQKTTTKVILTTDPYFYLILP